MASDRSAEDIQRDIEKARAGLAASVDQLAYRTSPKRVAENAKLSLRAKANTPQGRIALGVSGGLVLVLIIRRVRKR